jgi:hypothetical protein
MENYDPDSLKSPMNDIVEGLAYAIKAVRMAEHQRSTIYQSSAEGSYERQIADTNVRDWTNRAWKTLGEIAWQLGSETDLPNSGSLSILEAAKHLLPPSDIPVLEKAAQLFLD